jgi:metal-responsive CopG/Arc/MetJ family transcriptional regulator
MATTKERILVTLTPEMATELRTRAKRARVSRASLAAHAMRAWFEDEEDRYLSEIGDKIAENPGKFLSSAEFWKRVNKRRA